MKKKVKIYESEIKRATRRNLMESYLDEQHEMRDTYSRADFKSSPREQGVKDLFGKYGEEIPPSVLRYMRKNPTAIVKRLFKLYGNEIFDVVTGSGDDYMSVDAQSGKYGPYDRDNDGISNSVDQDDDGDGMLDLDGEMVGESEEVVTKSTKYSRDEVKNMTDIDGTMTLPNTNESTKSLLKKFLNTRK